MTATSLIFLFYGYSLVAKQVKSVNFSVSSPFYMIHCLYPDLFIVILKMILVCTEMASNHKVNTRIMYFTCCMHL